MKKRNLIEVVYYSFLLNATLIIRSLLNNLINYSVSTNEDDCFLLKVFKQKVNVFCEKQLTYINRESIFYTRSLILAVLLSVMYLFSKSILIMYLLISLFKFFVLPKYNNHNFTFNYVKNVLISLPLIIATLYVNIIVFSLLASIIVMKLCNVREYEEKYIYCNK